MKKDPVVSYRICLLAAGVAEATLDAIDAAAMATLDAATELAKASPLPEIATAYTDVFANGGAAWRN